MKIDSAMLEHLCELARLDLPQEERGEVLEQLGQLEQQVEKFCAYQCPQNPKEKGLLCPAGVFSPGFELPVEVQPRGSGAQQGQQAVRGEESAAKIPIG